MTGPDVAELWEFLCLYPDLHTNSVRAWAEMKEVIEEVEMGGKGKGGGRWGARARARGKEKEREREREWEKGREKEWGKEEKKEWGKEDEAMIAKAKIAQAIGRFKNHAGGRRG